MEVASPGAKHSFYFGFLDRAAPLFAQDFADAERGPEASPVTPCTRCGRPANNDVCAFCTLLKRVAPTMSNTTNRAVSVEIGRRPDMIDQ